MRIGHVAWLLPTFTDAPFNARVQRGVLNCSLAFSSYFPQRARISLWLLSAKPCQKMRLVYSPPSCSKTSRRSGGGICSGQILTFVEIMTRVQTSGCSTSLPAGPTHLQVWHGPNKKGYIRSDITQPELYDSLGCQQSVQDLFLSVQRSFPEPPKAPTRRPSEARYYCATYNWTARSPWFLDPTTLSDHPHILNIVTPPYQCGHLLTVADFSASLSYN